MLECSSICVVVLLGCGVAETRQHGNAVDAPSPGSDAFPGRSTPQSAADGGISAEERVILERENRRRLGRGAGGFTGIQNLPTIGRPQHIGALVGPRARASPNGVPIYGTDLGFTFKHEGQHFILFGDTWAHDDSGCDGVNPDNDDTLATLPVQYDGGEPPTVTFVAAPSESTASEPTAAKLRIYRGADSLRLGFGQVAIAAFSDGVHPFAVFERLEPVRCSDEQVAAAGACLPNGMGFCSTELGLCEPNKLAKMMCDVTHQSGCGPTQDCVAASFCIDRSSSQIDDGHSSAQAASVAYETELGVARSGAPGVFDSVLTWRTNRFSHPAVRTIAKLSGVLAGNDYRPGTDAMLYWGRPGIIAEQGRQAQLYLMSHRLPIAIGPDHQAQFEPRFFAGVDKLTGEPIWSDHEIDAQPLAQDGELGGSPNEAISVVGMYDVSWLPEPVNKWLLMYAGDFPDYLMGDTIGSRSINAPGAIMLRFADNPWGPWSPPTPHLMPGSPLRPGDPYGPGGYLYHPDCRSTAAASCAKSDPHRPLDTLIRGCPQTLPDPGKLYAPFVIDDYTRPNPNGGLDVFWNVSSWNPYGVELMKTTFGGATAPQLDELSDREGLERMSDWRALPRLAPNPGQYVEQTSRNRDDARDFNTFFCKSADAQIAETQSDPPTFALPECAEPYVHGVVLGHFVGKGRLVRTWLSARSLRDAPADNEVLRIYVDDDPTPRVEVPLADALDGHAGEIFAPPFGLAATDRLAWYYPVAFSQKLIVAIDNLGESDRYTYHCDAVLDDTIVPLPVGPRERLAERDDVHHQMDDRFHPAGDVVLLREPELVQLAADARETIVLDGPATIHSLRVRVSEAELSRLESVSLSVQWDGSVAPAVELPLAELFASDVAPPDSSSFALTSFPDVGERVLALNLPMPFANNARITLHNTGRYAAAFELRLLGLHTLPPGPFGHLHAKRAETLGPTFAQEHVALDSTGRGRLVGLCVHVRSRAAGVGDTLSLLAADMRARVDGRVALAGTGAEHIADDSFHFADAPHANAFAQAWGVTTQLTTRYGSANFCRWNVLGSELDYRASLHLSLALGGAENPNLLQRLRTVAYFYEP